MGKARRINVFLVLAMALIAALSCFFGVFTLTDNKKINASAATTDITNTIALENRMWSAGSEEYAFGVLNGTSQLLSASAMNDQCWYHGNSGAIAANNGVDILEYIYIGEKSARTLLTENATANNACTSGNATAWLTNPLAYPVCVRTYDNTTAGGVWINIAKAAVDAPFTFTFKAGFSFIDNNGNTLTISDDVEYTISAEGVPTKVQKYTLSFVDESSNLLSTTRVVAGSAIGELPAVPVKAGYTGWWTVDGNKITEETTLTANKTATSFYAKDITDTISLDNRAWGALSGEYYFGVMNNGACLNTAANISDCWYLGNGLVANNNGIDITEYIYVNGKSAKQWITDNNGALVGEANVTTTPWLSNALASPVCVRTSTADSNMGIMINILKSAISEPLTITFKKGFSVIDPNGEMLAVADDVNFTYISGAISQEQKYTLTFESVGTKRVLAGATIGELPAVPAKDGYDGVWEIDGETITADTVYNYGVAKTAVAVYFKDITSTISLDNRSWGALSGEYYFGVMNDGVCLNTAANISDCWYLGNGLVANNNGIDITEYIYVNGKSAKQWITDNNGALVGEANVTTTPWLSNALASPVCVRTSTADSNMGIMINILKVAISEPLTITFKKGFSVIDPNGYPCVISSDVMFSYANNAITKVESYTLSFEGTETAVEPITVIAGSAISNLPEVPAKDGYTGVWQIDGITITAETVYNYGTDKTATAVYTQTAIDVTDSISFEDRTWNVTNGVNGEYTHIGIRARDMVLVAHSDLGLNGTPWNGADATRISANGGVDFMDYIYINGKSARELSNENKINNTYKGSSTDTTGWLGNGYEWAPISVELSSDAGFGIMLKILRSYADYEKYTITIKAGFSVLASDGETLVVSKDVEFIYASGVITKVQSYMLSFEGLSDTVTVKTNQTIGELPEVPAADGKLPLYWAIDGVEITADTVWMYSENKTATPVYMQTYTLSFEGLDDVVTVVDGEAIGELPSVPENGGYEGYWTIDSVEIDQNTLYTYGVDKQAVAAYRMDITKYIALEDRAWGADEGEYYFGVLDMREANKVANGDSETYLLNSCVAGTWYVGNNAPISANNGVDIMEYIYINDQSARSLITANASGAQLVNSCGCWLSNAAASPVYVETTNGSGIMIKVLKAYAGNYFEITFKSGFSLINSDDITVYLTDDVTYKYIVMEGNAMLEKGELTDEDLDEFNGFTVTLMNGSETYFEKKTCRVTLPEIPAVIVGEEGLSQTFVGWTTDTTNLSNLYSAGHKMDITEKITLYAVWIGFELQDGAAVRLTSGSSGIRFLTDIDAGAYKLGVEKGLIKGAGTFLVPTDYLETGVDFVHSSFDAAYYLDKPTETWKVNGESDATWTYVAAFVNISEAQYSRRLSARGYLKIEYANGEGYVYTPYDEEVNARSIYEVATLAYDEYSSYQIIQDYVNKVANLTWDEADYSFIRTKDALGNYEITNITVDSETATVTVQLSGAISSAIVNGKRLVNGNNTNVKIGDFIYNLSGFTLVDGGFTFTIGAANVTYDKSSEDALYFESSDADLDFFLNDFVKRHSGVIEDGVNQRVNSVTAGVNSEEFYSHEWMSMSYYWYNSFEGYTNEQGNNSDRIAGLRNFLSSVPVDDYGYVWSSNDRVRDAYTEVSTGEQKMGWPFPNNDTVSTAHWEFNSGSGSWSSNISASASGGLYGKELSNQSSNITFTSNSFTSWTSKKVYTFYAPILEFEVRIDDATNIEDIYVWYSTNNSTSFSEDKKLSVKENAFLNYDLGNTSGAYNHVLYLPMYAESAWGESTSTYMKQLKIEIVLKSGKTISGNVALNYVRPTFDTRMSNNNSILISSLRQDYDYTGDLDYLQANITRARKAMNFLMQMYDSTRGLKKESYLVGHGGTKEDLNWLGKATNESIASSLSQGYWDIMYIPEYDFQSNMYFYKAARDLAYLEEVLAENGIAVDTSLATVKTATRNRTTGTSAYSYDLNLVADTVLTNLRQTTENTNHTGFWNSTNGRFVAGYASGESKWYDYGYVAWNLEAIYYGIATDEQAAAIMKWLESEDNLYKYTFAPISNTVTGDVSMLNGEYEAQGDDWVNCQYGGAIMYTSFYDLMARIDMLGADNAFARLTAIQNWYKEVYDYYVVNGNDPYDFYRYYYDNKGIQCQGMGTAGEVGLDREFLESFLPVSAVAYGFFGIKANGDTLTVAPELPAELTYWSMENLAFNFVKYDLTLYENAVQLNNVRGDATGLSLTVALNYTDGQSVYVNGMKVSDYTVENGKVYVTVDMGATVVEVR